MGNDYINPKDLFLSALTWWLMIRLLTYFAIPLFIPVNSTWTNGMINLSTFGMHCRSGIMYIVKIAFFNSTPLGINTLFPCISLSSDSLTLRSFFFPLFLALNKFLNFFVKRLSLEYDLPNRPNLKISKYVFFSIFHSQLYSSRSQIHKKMNMEIVPSINSR